MKKFLLKYFVQKQMQVYKLLKQIMKRFLNVIWKKILNLKHVETLKNFWLLFYKVNEMNLKNLTRLLPRPAQKNYIKLALRNGVLMKQHLLSFLQDDHGFKSE